MVFRNPQLHSIALAALGSPQPRTFGFLNKSSMMPWSRYLTIILNTLKLDHMGWPDCSLMNSITSQFIPILYTRFLFKVLFLVTAPLSILFPLQSYGETSSDPKRFITFLITTTFPLTSVKVILVQIIAYAVCFQMIH